MKPKIVALFAGLAFAACGGSVDKGPKKKNLANNADPNATLNNVVIDTNSIDNADPNVTPGNNESPCVTANPGSITFGDVSLGGYESATVSVRNCSTQAELVLLSVSTSGDFGASWPELALIQPQQAMDIELFFEPTVLGSASGDAVIETSVGQVIVDMTGASYATDGSCPTSVARGSVGDSWGTVVNAVPGQTVALSGVDSTSSDPIIGYEWSVVTRPNGSTAALSDPTAAEPTLFVDMPGSYEVEMIAVTSDEPANCEPGRVRVTAVPADADAIRVELTWDTPGDLDPNDLEGTDMDLHYMHANGTWNQAPWDCFWNNPDADWGAAGTAHVDLDDTNGWGPEIISHINPGAGTYDIGVYYYADWSLGGSTATVSVFQGQRRVGNVTQSLSMQGEFWWAGSVDSDGAFTSTGIVTTDFPTN